MRLQEQQSFPLSHIPFPAPGGAGVGLLHVGEHWDGARWCGLGTPGVGVISVMCSCALCCSRARCKLSCFGLSCSVKLASLAP